jgi:uncharacterized protein YndB with AHSA1/START domain
LVGSRRFRNTFDVFEFKIGGQWKSVLHGPDGKNYPNQIVFLALEPRHKVVIRHDCEPYFTFTALLVKVADGTNLTWEQVFDDAKTTQAVKHVVVPAKNRTVIE